MSRKTQQSKESKSIEPDASLEEDVKERTVSTSSTSSKKSKSKSSNIESLNEIFTSFLASFEKEKVKIEDVKTAWNSDENQAKLKELFTKLTKVKKASSKKKKDPARPKKHTAYILFCNENRESVKKANAGIDSKDILRKLGQKWQALSAKDKEKYKKKEVEDKKRFDKEMESYVEPDEYKSDNDGKKKKKDRDPTKPKRPISAFFIFMKENRELFKEKNPNKKGKEISKVAGEEWKKVSPKEKKEYEGKAKIEKAKYDKQMEIWKKKNGGDAKVPTKSKGKKDAEVEEEEDVEEEDVEDSEENGVDIALENFIKARTVEVKAKHPKMTAEKINEKVKKEWEKLSEEERSKFAQTEAEEEADEDEEEAELEDEDAEDDE